MAEHQELYHARMSEARAAEREGLYRKAVESALAAWEYIDGMMQYERRYDDADFASIPAIEMILKYAPLLFDFHSLEKLGGLLKECRRIEKNTSESLGDRLVRAQERMWGNHSLWDHLERHPEARQDELRTVLGGDQETWRAVAERWEKMGLLRRTPEGGSYRLALITRMGQVVPGKCPTCGEVVEAPKSMFLEETTCPECTQSVQFTILSTGQTTADEKG